MSMNRHDYFEELISASLAGDLTDAERQQLDIHLDTCNQCPAMLAAFVDQRRIMAGLRHVAPPRDMHARVRAGIQGGAFGAVPWWRRPIVLFGGLGGGLAAVAGALLAIVLLNGSPDGPPVGGSTGSPSPSPLPSPSASLFMTASAAPTASVALPTVTSLPSASEAPASPQPSASIAPELVPQPDVYLAYTGPFDNLLLTVRHGGTGETIIEVGQAANGPPIAAELSPDGEWLAYVTEVGQSGFNSVQAIRIAEAGAGAGSPEIGTTVALGETLANSPFLEVLAWSPDGAYLTYTLADPASGGATDIWLFETAGGEVRRLTQVGNAFTGSWVPGAAEAPRLWVSTAGEVPMSYLVDPTLGASTDPAESALTSAEGVFQPLLNPDGSRAIFWRGVMQRAGEEWLFSQGGSPYLADHGTNESGAFGFGEAQELFSDVTIEQDAFASAAIVWGPDSDAYAVWDAEWTGIPQRTGGDYPNVRHVYFGHASDPRGLTQVHAIDESDVPVDSSVVDVKVTTGRHLLITARRPSGGVMEAPLADLFLVTRNTGTVADEVFRLPDDSRQGWFGPAAHDAPFEVLAP